MLVSFILYELLKKEENLIEFKCFVKYDCVFVGVNYQDVSYNFVDFYLRPLQI